MESISIAFNNVVDFLILAVVWIKAHPNEIALLAALAGSILQIIRERMQAREAIFLVINTLKDEKKLTEAGTFTSETVAKVERVAETMKAGAVAVGEVKEIFATVAPGNPGIKVFSYNGRPVYLEQVTAVGSRLAAALSVLRGIIRR